MTPRPILHVDHASALGGAEFSLLLLMKHLDRQRWSPHLAAPDGLLTSEAMAMGIPVHPLTMPRLRRSQNMPLLASRTAWELARIARSIDATIIHSNTVRASLYCAAAAKLAHRPLLWHMRDFWLSESRPDNEANDRRLKRLLCASSQKVLANSAAVGRHLPCPRQLAVVYNGIETDTYDPTLDAGSFRNEFGIPGDRPVIGMIGRMRPWKGQESFLQAACLIKQQMPETHFLVVGGDPFQVEDDYGERLQELTKTLGLAAHTTFTGQLADVRPALAAMRVFVHPGAPEPFGLVNIEAMAMARPVVAFSHGALPEIVAADETGLLVTPGDEEGLANAVISLLSDDTRLRQMGEAGRARACKEFDIRTTVQRIERHYTALLGLPKRGRVTAEDRP